VDDLTHCFSPLLQSLVHQFKALPCAVQHLASEGNQHSLEDFLVDKADPVCTHLMNKKVMLPIKDARDEQVAQPLQLFKPDRLGGVGL
jgi:hypothetical protein